MLSKFVRSLAGLSLVVSATFLSQEVIAADANPTPRSPTQNSNLVIDTPPVRNQMWPACTFADQEYCYEPLSIVTDLNSAPPTTAPTTTIASTTTMLGAPTSTPSPQMSPTMGYTPYANCHINGQSPEYCVFDGTDWMEVGVNGEFTQADTKKIFRWKLRTGKFEPDVMMLGETLKMVVGGDDTSGWTLEIWARPAVKAYLNGCHSAQTCPSTSVAESVRYALNGYAKMLYIGTDRQGVSGVATVELRNALRGTFISTNGMSQSWTFSQDWFYVTAVSPHFLPPVNGAPSEVTPGFVKVFLPEKYFTLDRGYKDLTMVTADRVKMRVSGQNATANVVAQDGGMLIDTGVTHFSAPNPEFSVLKATDSVAAAPVSPIVSATTPQQISSTISRPVLKKGATKTLASIAKTTKAQKPKWAAKGACKISGSRVFASKKSGTCTVTLRVLNSKKKYVVKTTKVFTVK